MKQLKDILFGVQIEAIQYGTDNQRHPVRLTASGRG